MTTEMKTLVTHINPHLDDISAIWLFKRFHPNFIDAQLEFISASLGAAKGQESEDKIFLGTGGGKFDEHKSDSGECATSLVWTDLREKGLTPKDDISVSALKELVEWSRLIDLGKYPIQPFEEFSVQAFIRPKDTSAESSKKAIELGMEILDRILEVLKQKHLSLKDWQKATQFKSTFGKSFAIESEHVDRDFCKKQPGELFIMRNPQNKSVQYFTPNHQIDLEPIYTKLKEVDPKADWFLHQAHHMILCGAGAAPDFIPSELSLEELIEVAKQS